jgi:hypothetical protein
MIGWGRFVLTKPATLEARTKITETNPTVIQVLIVSMTTSFLIGSSLQFVTGLAENLQVAKASRVGCHLLGPVPPSPRNEVESHPVGDFARGLDPLFPTGKSAAISMPAGNYRGSWRGECPFQRNPPPRPPTVPNCLQGGFPRLASARVARRIPWFPVDYPTSVSS